MNFSLANKSLNIARLTQSYINSTSISFPARLGYCPPKIIICIINSSIVLFFVFIFRRAQCFIPVFPESFDKNFSLFISFELKKNIFFNGRNNIDNFLFKPYFVLLRKFTENFFISLNERNNASKRRRQIRCAIAEDLEKFDMTLSRI